MTTLILITLATAFASMLLLVPLVRAGAIRVGLVDNPDAERKLHARPIALAGGLAVFIATGIAFVTGVAYESGWQEFEKLTQISSRWYVLLGASTAILVVGLIDDKWALRGRQKLLAQVVISMIVVGSGTVMNSVSLFGWDIPLGIFAIPVSVLWLLLSINALNLLDGADGMATTVGAFVCGGLALLSASSAHSPSTAIAATALCGALIGFLVFNRPPASIFLGDAGSMMIGLMVGVLAMWCSLKESAVLVAAPVAILVLPLFDSTAAIVRRWMTGRSMYATDRGHLHHLLSEKFGPNGMLMVVAGLCTFSSAIAILSVKFQQEWLVPIGAIGVLGFLVLTRTFGHSECRLLLGRVYHFAHSFAVRPQQCDSSKQLRTVKLQGEGCWEPVWEPLVEFAKAHDFAKVQIDANMAWLHEGYHATWQSVRLPEKAFQNVVRIPLYATRPGDDEAVPIGKVEVITNSTTDSLVYLGYFLEHVEELQAQVHHLVDKLNVLRSRKATSDQAGQSTDAVDKPLANEVEAATTS
ncbi:undecaprenyl/decaprenyl-phosphate alpha-N-acetylglucosaminyl 1-phosphate transferase [Rhodopirellula sp. JC740]|uniref:Undecaprenyl/decaprenyl-phosphate alpha-N-acetylglucosaminyl 1-phosphate transferase n=1 Tax=Rhodopirellula halodulae TaxID=2894198 RepID=A0ABS8ND01_9BACT|nr:MraY family glycosyltransferase [Rhodopirellula sp. JC740]MCC9641431.1 undecaprenyl/decaprenyl-phosphate alpha-N-acetylglucosaminyl 1-phosphate transferase [Rhodopirellula sp. JC740]